MSGGAPSGTRASGRRWFLALAWVTLVLFAVFVAVIVVGVASIPRLRRGRRARGTFPGREGGP